MATWTHKPQERAGEYFFDGRAFQTAGVAEALSPEEILWIVRTLQRFVIQHGGADYIQSFECDDGRRVWCICQLSGRMKRSGEFTEEQLSDYDYWTMLLPLEY